MSPLTPYRDDIDRELSKWGIHRRGIIRLAVPLVSQLPSSRDGPYGVGVLLPSSGDELTLLVLLTVPGEEGFRLEKDDDHDC